MHSAFALCSVDTAQLCLGVGLKSLAVACVVVVYLHFLHHLGQMPQDMVTIMIKQENFLSLHGQMQFLCFFFINQKVIHSFVHIPKKAILLEPVFVFFPSSENSNLFIMASWECRFIYKVCAICATSHNIVLVLLSCIRSQAFVTKTVQFQS